MHAVKGHSEKAVPNDEWDSYYTIYISHPEFEDTSVNGNAEKDSGNYIHVQLVPLSAD